jgi:hypothetical protein
MSHWSEYDDKFPSPECKAAFEKFHPYTRVGCESDEWNTRKRAFVAGWTAQQPYRDELMKIAADLGEPNDPFAAWERVVALREG